MREREGDTLFLQRACLGSRQVGMLELLTEQETPTLTPINPCVGMFPPYTLNSEKNRGYTIPTKDREYKGGNIPTHARQNT